MTTPEKAKALAEQNCRSAKPNQIHFFSIFTKSNRDMNNQIMFRPSKELRLIQLQRKQRKPKKNLKISSSTEASTGNQTIKNYFKSKAELNTDATTTNGLGSKMNLNNTQAKLNNTNQLNSSKSDLRLSPITSPAEGQELEGESSPINSHVSSKMLSTCLQP